MATSTVTGAPKGSTETTTAGPSGGTVPRPRQHQDLPTGRRKCQTVPVSPAHLTEQARRRSEALQASIDIAAGW